MTGETSDAPTNQRVTHRMRSAARELLAHLDDDQRRAVQAIPGDSEARRWTYLPGPRPGLNLAEIDADTAELALALVSTASGPGDQTRGAIALERIRHELAHGSPPVSDAFWIRIAGSPDDALWGWRINGHHVGVHVQLAGSRYTVTPHFLGAQPVRVPTGPQAGYRLLGPEEDLARALLATLDPDRLAVAVATDVAPVDILTRHDPVTDPSVLPVGIGRPNLPTTGQDLLDQLVRRYLSRAPQDYAQQCWTEIEQDGVDLLRFAWAGPTDPQRSQDPGHYYCITAPTMIIEYDNTQDGADHAHSVWRHRRDDWGEDLLRRHYADGHVPP